MEISGIIVASTRTTAFGRTTGSNTHRTLSCLPKILRLLHLQHYKREPQQRITSHHIASRHSPTGQHTPPNSPRRGSQKYNQVRMDPPARALTAHTPDTQKHDETFIQRTNERTTAILSTLLGQHALGYSEFARNRNADALRRFQPATSNQHGRHQYQRTHTRQRHLLGLVMKNRYIPARHAPCELAPSLHAQPSAWSV